MWVRVPTTIFSGESRVSHSCMTPGAESLILIYWGTCNKKLQEWILLYPLTWFFLPSPTLQALKQSLCAFKTGVLNPNPWVRRNSWNHSIWPVGSPWGRNFGCRGVVNTITSPLCQIPKPAWPDQGCFPSPSMWLDYAHWPDLACGGTGCWPSGLWDKTIEHNCSETY